METKTTTPVKDTHVTEVIFRKFKDGDIIALFPYEIENYKGHVMSYMHVGQHSGADYLGVVATTKPAKTEDFSDLQRELESLGYNLKVIQKRNLSKFHEKLREMPIK